MTYSNIQKHLTWWTVLAAVCGGLLETLSWPKAGLWPLSFCALVPLILVVQGQKPKTAFFLGWLYGLSLTLSSIPWLGDVLVGFGGLGPLVGWLIFVLLSALLLAMYHALFAWLICRPGERRWLWILTGALYLCGIDWLKNWIFTGFNWTPLAGPLALSPVFGQAADLIGFYGLGFLVALVNFFLADAILARQKVSKIFINALGAVIIIGGLWGYGHFSLKFWQMAEVSNDFEQKTISAIQPSVAQDKKWSSEYRDDLLIRYAALLQKAQSPKPWLIIWPETALPFLYGHNSYETDWLNDLSLNASSPMLVGVGALEENADGKDEQYNRAWLFDQGRPLAFYDKQHRVPFGEYLPTAWLPFLKWDFLQGLIGEAGTFAGGKIYDPISLDGHKLGMLICFESTFPYLARQRILEGAGFLIVTTNDAWFGLSAAPMQHFIHAQMRAIETRRALVRVGNNGISGVIYPDGDVYAKSELNEIAAFHFSVPILKENSLFNTFFVSYGFLFSPFCGILTGLAILWTFIFRPKSLEN